MVEAHRLAERRQRLRAPARPRGRRGAPPRSARLRTAARSGRARAPRPTGCRRCRRYSRSRSRRPSAASLRAVGRPPIRSSSGRMVLSRIAGRASRQSSHGKKRYHGSKPAPAARATRIVGHAREREIADRDHVRAGIAGLGVTAAVAERVELLHIADAPGRSAPRRRRAARSRRCDGRADRTARTAVRLALLVRRGRRLAGDQDGRLLVLDRHDRGGEADLDGGEGRVGHARV